ncbi:uncharacterized protein L201_001443 [Kwoniella dendrophila CBS 6074]|uniref:Uncharacterized protein n=1 Tax=Kwoniella dendrophila CBS 6074 TaxID=1295534 RepID=A0AAX4JMB7_9TREE
MLRQTLTIQLFYLTLLASSALGAINTNPNFIAKTAQSKASKPKPYPFKQTTRVEILKRQKKKSLRVRRSVPSNVPGPADVSPTTDDSVTYYFFHRGVGAYETDDNPSNDSDWAPPATTTISGSEAAEDAVQSCADFSWDQGYFAFQVYYRRSTDQWTCTSYIFAYKGDQSSSAYFNLKDDDVTLAYGYQQNWDENN